MSTHSLLLLLLALLSIFYLHSNDWDGPWKLPFRTSDILPLLPFSALRPILSSVHSAVDLLPAFVGTVSSPETDLNWKGACFYKNYAWMEFHNKSKSPYGGGTLHIKVSSWLGFAELVYLGIDFCGLTFLIEILLLRIGGKLTLQH